MLLEDNREGKPTQCTIKKIISTDPVVELGVRVECEDGRIGRVAEILDGHVSGIPVMQEIPVDEDDATEFKSTFRLDLNRFEKGDGKMVRNPEVEKEISVTVSAMANAEGGVLLIGVGDDGEVLGLEKDYELLQNPSDDKFQRTVWQSIQNFVQNKAYVAKLKISLIQKDSKKICRIDIPRSDEPIFVHENNAQVSYVRVGPKSEKFSPADFMKYAKTRFEE